MPARAAPEGVQKLQSKRLIHLECARGVASIIVIFHHFSLAFFPHLKAAPWDGGLRYTPLYILFNGDGAVTYFFTLSGFVLTLSFYRRYSGAKLLAAICKRLPRLMVPAGASILLGYLILKYFPALHQVAATISGSPWLAEFGRANMPADLQPSVVDAARQSLFVFLRSRDFYYNSNLWTMSNEFYGSLIVFGFVLFSGFATLRKRWVITVLHIAAVIALAKLHNSFVPFVVGSYLAYIVSSGAVVVRISSSWTWALLAAAAVGYSVDHWIALTMASLFVMVALLGDRKLSSRLSGSVGEWLGALSFPLYLVHTLVILSLSSFVFALLSHAQGSCALVSLSALGVTVLASLILALPFMVLDKKWVFWLNKITRRLVERTMTALPERAVG